MAGYLKKKKKKRISPALIAVPLVLILIAAAVILIPKLSGGEVTNPGAQTSGKPNGTGSAAEGKPENAVTFPCELEGGKITAESLFQSSILNPDCGNEYADNIASLEIANRSEEFCKSLTVTVTMPDGANITFRAADIPAGKTVWAFASGNETVDLQADCIGISSEADFGAADLMEDKITVSTEGTTVTLQNISGTDLSNLTVNCHCLFDEVYFGGITYSYPVASIPAGGTVTVDAIDCFLGDAEVVSVVQNG